MIKQAFVQGAMKAIKDVGHMVAEHPKFHSTMDLAGLGILMAPSIATLSGHESDKKTEAAAEVAGLGTLAVPSLIHSFSKNPPGHTPLLSRMVSRLTKHADSQLEMGKEVEKEHEGTIKDLISKKGKDSVENVEANIAKDHLKEIPDYYTRLKKMESEAKHG